MQDRHLEAARLKLESETVKCTKLETLASNQKAELARVQSHAAKLNRDLSKVLTDLKNREWELQQIELKQDKTIVEHVHVLEEAKRVTDRQLAEAQAELQKNAIYIRSLEKAKNRLVIEAEDMKIETERKRVELRSKEKAARSEARVEEDGRDMSELDLLRHRLAEELGDERKQHQKDLAERDFTADQTRKKYQGMQGESAAWFLAYECRLAELAQLSEGAWISI